VRELEILGKLHLELIVINKFIKEFTGAS